MKRGDRLFATVKREATSFDAVAPIEVIAGVGDRVAGADVTPAPTDDRVSRA